MRQTASPALRLLVAGVLLLTTAILAYSFWPGESSLAPLAVEPIAISATAVPPAQPGPTRTIPATPLIPAPSPAMVIATLPAPPPGAITATLVPAAGAVGWTTSLDGRSHFNVPNIHAGVFGKHVYYGAFQIDLAPIPAGSAILYAAVELVGREARSRAAGESWQLRLLASGIDPAWPELTHARLAQAPTESTLTPALSHTDLGPGRVNQFPLSPEQLDALERRLGRGAASFRLDGPTAGDDNLFTWDSGYRPGEALASRPVLRLIFIPPDTPDFVIVTSTPTPENAITAAAQAALATEVAADVGTYTPVPANWVTPIVIDPSPAPANAATAAFQAELATAEAFLYGTATPTPANVWTATPTSGSVAVTSGGATPTGTPGLPLVIVTSAPTPKNVLTVAAIAATATQAAVTIGTQTPIPPNWVTPIVVTPWPTPVNAATAAYRAGVATAEAFLYGTATPTPVNVWTATPTPIFVPVQGEVATPWATSTPTATPQPIPPVLLGKIAFLSNRSGGQQPLEKPLVYLIDPDGGNLAVLTDRTLYDLAIARDSYSADQRFRAFVKNALRFDSQPVPALYIYDYFYDVESQVTNFGAGAAWDPVWSPAREQLAFVSNDSGDDEIWVVNRDGSGARQLTESNEAFNAREIGKDTFIPEVNGHPSWSPDGGQLVFWSNRTGHRQIWVMNADGSNLRSLSTTGFDDWNPVWFKYTDPARRPGLD